MWGRDFLRNVDGIADENGYVKVRDTYQTEKYDDIYAVGIAAAVAVPRQTPNPVGIPKTGFPTEAMAHVAASNIAAQIKGELPGRHKEFADIKAICVMDAGNNGVLILADKMLPPRKHAVLIPGAAEPRHEARVREVLPVEDEGRARDAALTAAGPISRLTAFPPRNRASTVTGPPEAVRQCRQAQVRAERDVRRLNR